MARKSNDDAPPSLTQRVLTLLATNPEWPYSPWEIRRIFTQELRIAISRGSLTKIVSRLRRNGRIQYYKRHPEAPPMRGYYTISPHQDIWKFLEKIRGAPQIHNTKIYVLEALVPAGDRLLRPRPEDLFNEILARNPGAEGSGNRKWVYLDLAPGRRLTLGIHQNGSMEAWLKCGTQPLPLPEYGQYLKLLRFIIGPDIWDHSQKEVQQIEFNEDYQGVRINGLSNISVDRSEGEILQIYQKYDDTVRAEKRYFLHGLEPEVLAREINRVDKKADGLIKTAHIASLNDEVRTIKSEIQNLTGALHAQTAVLSIITSSLGKTLPPHSIPVNPGTSDRGPPDGYR